jgi:hypothetical protein
VFRGQNDAWKYRMYHRKDGLLVKEGDDAISASRYAMMMKRYGETSHRPAPRRLMQHRIGGRRMDGGIGRF